MSLKYKWVRAHSVEELNNVGAEYVLLTLEYGKEGNKWLGTCRELGTSTFARTLGKCQNELEELVTEHLNLLEEDGERENFFKKWKIEVRGPKRRTPAYNIKISKEDVDRIFHVPQLSERPLFQPTVFFPTSPKQRRSDGRELTRV